MSPIADKFEGQVADLLRGSTDCLLLSLIAEGPMYGYQLIKQVEKRSNGYFRFKEGTVYPALHRLEDDGLVQARRQQSPNGQERRYYHITEKGQRALEQKMALWRRFADAVNLVIEPSKA